MFPGIGCENKIKIPLSHLAQGHYDNFNFKIASSPEAAASAYEAYSSVFADFHPKRRRAKTEDEAVEWRINRREAAAQGCNSIDVFSQNLSQAMFEALTHV